ncbi:SMP-30/gluconolactonase/LRE family protein [Nocardia stercoris]|uniref:SMP-30/Gluconolactonase/LRE-like region domain-containing protein n=1 Tax=Nocardia stercoris TaxID=2483361 RepID=A0A3M2KYM3_9NOCA|nr:hypothetical protein [Nocardia stercoris]RMI30381.1 hypothetical protein EBN03_22335 [Nocardia stercoris]
MIVRFTVPVAAALVTAGLLTAPAATAAPICPGAGQPVIRVAEIPGTALQALTVDPDGRAYVADLTSGRVFRIDAPGAAPSVVATVPAAGGLAWLPDGRLLIGYGSDARVLVGDAARAAGIVVFDPATGTVSPFADGLSAASGLTVAHDGTVFATNDFGDLVARIAPDGTVQADWAHFPSVNGGVLDPANRYIYASRTFVNPGVSRIPVAAPWAPESLLDFTGGDLLAAPDDPTLDSLERPVLPLNPSGRIIRIDAPGRYCELGSGDGETSVVTYGRGSTGFAAGHLYAATFTGIVDEIPGGFDPAATTLAP